MMDQKSSVVKAFQTSFQNEWVHFISPCIDENLCFA